MWKSKIDSAVRDFQPLKKQFATWTFFLGGGEKGGGGGGCFISLSLVGNKNVENKNVILFTGWEGIIKKL